MFLVSGITKSGIGRGKKKRDATQILHICLTTTLMSIYPVVTIQLMPK